MSTNKPIKGKKCCNGKKVQKIMCFGIIEAENARNERFFGRPHSYGRNGSMCENFLDKNSKTTLLNISLHFPSLSPRQLILCNLFVSLSIRCRTVEIMCSATILVIVLASLCIIIAIDSSHIIRSLSPASLLTIQLTRIFDRTIQSDIAVYCCFCLLLLYIFKWL